MDVIDNSPTSVDLIIGQQIARRRQSLGLAVEDVCAELKISAELYVHIEAGQARANALLLYRLARYMKVNLAYFHDPDSTIGR